MQPQFENQAVIPEPKRKIPKWLDWSLKIFSAVIVGLILVTIGYMLFGKCARCATPKYNLEWKTYRNEEYGFEFKYPAKYGDVITEYNEGYYSGDILRVTFIKNENLKVSSISNDYRGWMDMYATILKEDYRTCSERTDYENGYGCKITTVGGTEAVFINSVFDPECSFLFGSDIVLKNPNDLYNPRTIVLSVNYPGSKEIEETYSCIDKELEEITYQKIKQYSQSIMERDGLIKEDAQILEEVNDIISTFKFISTPTPENSL